MDKYVYKSAMVFQIILPDGFPINNILFNGYVCVCVCVFSWSPDQEGMPKL